MNQVYLALGSNLGNREKNIHLAFDQLKMRLTSLSTSRIYETEPLYITKQPKFLNAVLQGSTTLKPYDLLKDLHKIEELLGRNRKRDIVLGPRTMDIDILLYANKVINTLELVLPHPKIKEREFVLIPLLELNSDLADPTTGELYSEALKKLEKQGVYFYSEFYYNR